MNEKLAQALDYISEAHIAEAAKSRRNRRFWYSAIAAVLAIALLLNMPHIPMAVSAKAVATASESRAPVRPDLDDYEVWEDYRADLDIYEAILDRQDADVSAALTTLTPFFRDSASGYMAGSTENRVWSPINAYIALAMLAEITGGNSRQQILDLLDTPDLETLRSQVGAVWEEVYKDDGNEISVLANSLWLDNGVNYDQETMNNVAHYHYASIYQSNLSSSQAGRALRTWLNNNTGGLLKSNTANASFPPEAVLTLASTVYLQSKWSDEFNTVHNTVDTFHSPTGDVNATFMNKKEYQTNYYWGESFGAVSLWLKNGCKMWFFLPDADKTVDDVLSEGEYLTLLPPSEEERENSKYMKVNLSVPKFDISSSGDLKEMLWDLGITDIFNEEFSDFTAITSDTPVCITAVNQAARVIIDEQGVKAASYLEFPGAGAAMPPEEIIDFILDRPFLFVIADTSGIPLFTGVVNDPS